MRKISLLPVLLLLLAGTVHAQPVQDKTQIEKEREELQRELKEIEVVYNKVKQQKSQTLGQLSVLNKKINLQEQYIGSINKEIRFIDDDIYLSNIEIYRLQKQLDTLKGQYAKTIIYAYKNRSSYDYLNFIFSANSFNDAIKRVAYLKSYRSYREKQVNNILETQQLIEKRKVQQLTRKDKKNAALTDQTKQVEELAQQKKEKDAIVTKLKSQEKDLAKQIAAKKKRDRDLQNAILAIVRREVKAKEDQAKAEAAAKKKADDLAKKNNTPVTANITNINSNPNANNVSANNATAKVDRTIPVKKPESYLDLNAKDVELNNKFELNRARLPWPVDNGIVTFHYGMNKIENTLLTFDNPGITIATPSSGVPVKAIFDGEVSGVYNMGDGMAITIRHGKYFTTYSNLGSVSVSKGAVVKTGQPIGKAGKDDNGGGGQIDFILMIETRNVDPQPWLRR